MDRLHPVVVGAAAPWGLVVTEPGAPRSDRIVALVDGLAGRGLRVGGVMQRTMTIEGERRYLACRLGRAERVHLGRRGSGARPGEEAYCHCLFATDGFARVRAWLEQDQPGSDVLLIDELSRMEAAGRGHTGAVSWALGCGSPVILSVRADQLAGIMDRFGLGEPVAAIEADQPIGGLVSAIAAAR